MLLNAIQDIVPIAKDMKIIVEKDVISDEMIDTFVAMLQEVRQNITDIAQQQKLDKTANILNKIRNLEEAQHQKDQAKIQEIETMLQDL